MSDYAVALIASCHRENEFEAMMMKEVLDLHGLTVVMYRLEVHQVRKGYAGWHCDVMQSCVLEVAVMIDDLQNR